MGEFLSSLGSMSLQAGCVVLVVLVVRQLFAKLHVPKKYMGLLWLIPYLCMICPFRIETAFGVWRQPQDYQLVRVNALMKEVERNIGKSEQPMVADELWPETGAQVSEVLLESSMSGDVGTAMAVDGLSGSEGNPVPGIFTGADTLAVILFALWLAGMLGVLIYSLVSYVRLQRKLVCSMPVRDNVYVADDIDVPFVLGILKPRIYLPGSMDKEKQLYVLAHENTHIRRWDPLKKLAALFATAVHWFNPFAWAAFHFMEKDMEMSCDEETLLRLGMEQKQAYASALLQLSSGKKLALGAPLAFGEGNVKNRIRNIVGFKKTWKIISILAVVLIAVLAVVFMTSASPSRLKDVEEEWAVFHAENEPVSLEMNGVRTDFPAAYCKAFIEFFVNVEVAREPISDSRSEDRAKDIAIGFDDERFYYLNENCTEIWSDNRVKPGKSYRILNPQEVRDFLEKQLGSITEAVKAEPEDGSETLPSEPEASESGAQTGENVPDQPNVADEPEPDSGEIENAATEPALTMEDLITMCKEQSVGETMQNYAWQDGLIPENFVHNPLEYSLTWAYECILPYGDREYRLFASYWKPEVAADYGYTESQLSMVSLMEMATGDTILLYSEDERYTVNTDIEEFLGREYGLEHYLTLTLPEGTRLGQYHMGMNDVFHGSLMLGDFEEEDHGSGVPKAWFSAGGVGMTAMDDRAEFVDGRLEVYNWRMNHSGGVKVENLEGCAMPAVLYEYSFDLFTLPELDAYAQEKGLAMEEIDSTSEFWYVFMAEPEGEYVYTVFMNKEYFTKEDIIRLARSITFRQ